MYKLYDIYGMKYEALGEIDNGLVLHTKAERLDLCDVWPGKRTDMESLERNAAAFRREERRRFFRQVRQVVHASLKALLAAKMPGQIPQGGDETKSSTLGKASSPNNFVNILAGTYSAALYRGQIPAKDERYD